MVRPKGLEPSTPKLKVSYSTIWVTSAYGGFSHFRVFPCLVIIHTTNNPTLYANFALLLGNILGAFFNVVAPIHDVELVKGIEPSLSDWKSEVLPLLNYTCIREVVLVSFPSHGARYRIRTDTVSLPSDFKSLAYTCSANRANGDATGIRTRVASVKGMWTNHYSIAPKERDIYLRILGHISDPAPRW